MYSFFGLANVQSILVFDYSWPKAQANQMTTEQKSFAAEWPANFWENMEERDRNDDSTYHVKTTHVSLKVKAFDLLDELNQCIHCQVAQKNR